MKVQVTLFDKDNRYKPVSAIIEVESVKDFKEHEKEYKTKAIQKICIKRLWTKEDLIKYNYTTCKCRIYDPEKIAELNKRKYEEIKKQRGWK